MGTGVWKEDCGGCGGNLRVGGSEASGGRERRSELMGSCYSVWYWEMGEEGGKERGEEEMPITIYLFISSLILKLIY